MRFSHHLLSVFACGISLGCTGSQIVEVQITDNPNMILERVFNVTLSEPASLAIRCTRDDLPTEVHLVESSGQALTHELRVQGLLAETGYTCDVAPLSQGGISSTGAFTTGALPSYLPSATTTSNGTPGADYTFMPHQRLAAGETTIQLVLMDNDGGIRWYYPLPIEGYADMGAEYWGDGLFLWGGVSASGPGEGAPRLVDVSHNEQYRAAYPGSDEAIYHHMTEQQYDSTVVTLVEADASLNGQDYYGFEVHRVNVENDELVWSWNLQRALDNEGIEVGDANWAGVMVDETGVETMIISVCEGEGVIGVDVASGDVAWSLAEWGTLDLTKGDLPRVQHGLDIRDNRILLYDNGAVPTTRAVEFEIDAASGTATQTWSWTEDGFSEPWGWGDVDYLGNDRVVIAKGHIPDWGSGDGPSEVIEVNMTDSSVAWRLSFSDELDGIYSADRIDGCDLFTDTSRCESLANRLQTLSSSF